MSTTFAISSPWSICFLELPPLYNTFALRSPQDTCFLEQPLHTNTLTTMSHATVKVCTYISLASGTFPKYSGIFRFSDLSVPALVPEMAGLLSSWSMASLPCRLAFTRWNVLSEICSRVFRMAEPLPRSNLECRKYSILKKCVLFFTVGAPSPQTA